MTSVCIDGGRTITTPEFEEFRSLIRRETGICLKDTKRSLVTARLGRRLSDLGLSSFGEYYKFLNKQDSDGSELRRMINCITTNKTSFFREPNHFPVLAELVRGRTGANGVVPPLRFWSAACSTGEEPYSMAITIRNAAPAAQDVRILASDIDTDVLSRAESGTYEESDISDVGESVRRKFFLRGTGECAGLISVKPSIRALITFRQINLNAENWPIHTQFDAIFCRNVVIYFDHEVQARLFRRLAGYLKPHGLLFVGHSESLYWLSELFEPADHAVYRFRGGAARE